MAAPTLPRAQLDDALELFHQRRIDLEGLCTLVAELGARATGGKPVTNVARLARSMSLFVHERHTVQSSVSGAASQVAGGGLQSVAPGGGDASQIPDEAPADVTRRIAPVPEDSQVLLKTSPGLPAIKPEGGASAGDGAPNHTVVVSRDRMVESASSPRASGNWTTPLQRYCLSRQVMPRIGPPGLLPEGPAITASGDEKYAWGRELGMGGVGHVNLAVDRDLRRTVAVKTLREESLHDAVQVQAFVEEAIVTGGLVHPNIVPVYALGYSEEHGPYYTMKRLSGEPLSRILARINQGDPDTVKHWGLFRQLDCFVGILQAIDFAHDHGVVHCDLKPSNVIVGHYGEVTVVDWGLARVLGEGGEGQARALLTSGTPAYMPPEQATGRVKDLDEQSDIWSLGAILYEILTGTVPFEAETSELTILRLMADQVELPSERAPSRAIPPSLEQICMRALRKDKLERYPSVREMIADVKDYLEGVREARRREEVAQHAVDEAHRMLERAAEAEASADRLQAQRLEAARHGVSHEAMAPIDARLDDARDDLVFAYSDVTRALARGHEAMSDHPRLLETIGDLYWRVFARLYPARVPPSEGVREQGMSLLQRLSQMGFSAVVVAGRRHGTQDATRSTLGRVASEDPWLDAVLSFCGDELELPAERVPGAMAPLVRRIAFLKGVALFAGMAGSDLLPIAEACDQLTFVPGHTIFAQGDVGNALYVVTHGAVDILHDGNLLTTLTETDCFGEIAVLDQAPRTAGAVCRTEVGCLVLTAERFRRIVSDHGNIGLSVIQVLTQRLRAATEREASLRNSLSG